MKKRMKMIAGMLALTVSLCMTPANNVNAMAETWDEPVVVLTTESDESTGEMVLQTKGQYLQRGISNISEVGLGKISVGGTTIAQQVVDTIKISVMVEKYVDGKWVSYTSWSATDHNTYKVSTNKTLIVPRGTYYRVYCVHSANSEVGQSDTSGVYVD